MKKQPSGNHLGHLFGWLGRQVGYVKKAIQTDPAAPKAAAAPGPKTAANAPTVIYREDKVEEAELPNQPGVKLRRTVIDEVIVDDKKLNHHEDTRARRTEE